MNSMFISVLDSQAVQVGQPVFIRSDKPVRTKNFPKVKNTTSILVLPSSKERLNPKGIYIVKDLKKVGKLVINELEEIKTFYRFKPRVAPLQLRSELFRVDFSEAEAYNWTDISQLRHLVDEYAGTYNLRDKLVKLEELNKITKVRVSSKKFKLSPEQSYFFQNIRALDIDHLEQQNSELVPLLRRITHCNIYKTVSKKEILDRLSFPITISRRTNKHYFKQFIGRYTKVPIKKRVFKHLNNSVFLSFKFQPDVSGSDIENPFSFLAHKNMFMHKSIQVKSHSKKIKRRERLFSYLSHEKSASLSVSNGDISVFQFIAQHLVELPFLTKINFAQNNIASNEFEAVFKNLKTLKYLNKLKLTGNKLKCFEIKTLTQNIAGLTNLKYLNLSQNIITDKGFGFLALGLVNLEGLEYLNLSYNRIEPSGTKALAPSFKGLKRLKFLFFENCFLETSSLIELVRNISPSLKELDLSKNRLDDPLFPEMTEIFRSFPALTHLYLNNCNLSNLELLPLFNSIYELNLQVFEIKHNQATSKVFETFFSLDMFRKSLTSLGIRMKNSGNINPSTIATILSRSLGKFKKLECLDLAKMNFGDSELELLSRVFDKIALKVLILKRNQLNNNSIQQLLFNKYSLKHLEYLDLGNNPLSDTGKQNLAKLLGNLTKLTILKLKRLKIGYKDLKSIMKSAVSNTKLDSLDLSFNDFGFDGLDYLVQKVKEFKKLRILAVKGIQDSNSNVRYCVVEVEEHYYSNLSIYFK